VPAATPLPRGPSVLTLYSADDLLTAPGCPVCRYTAEASDRYLGWFALEGHGEPTAISSLCSSLGSCPSHTRRLMAQPGAAIRLTAVYRYVLTAARDRLTTGTQPVRDCPACEHDRAAADRALDTLLEGLADGRAKSRYQDLGGVCIPHLAEAAGSRHRRIAAWLAQVQQEVLGSSPRAPGWLAGLDQDAEIRAVLRQSIPMVGTFVPGACAVCLAVAQAERDRLDEPQARSRAQLDEAVQEPSLCARHLSDAAIDAARAGGLNALLGTQAGSAMARPGGLMARWQRGRRAAAQAHRCAVCKACAGAEQRELAEVGRSARWPDLAARLALCVRHHLALRAADQRASSALIPFATETADLLIAELAEAFKRTTEARRVGSRAPGSTAWRRAAAYLDGAVFGGCPPRDRS
jgi:hypothetical protein